MRKYKIQNEINDFKIAIQKFPEIDFGLYALTENLMKNLEIAIKYKTKSLIEKSILIESNILRKKFGKLKLKNLKI